MFLSPVGRKACRYPASRADIQSSGILHTYFLSSTLPGIWHAPKESGFAGHRDSRQPCFFSCFPDGLGEELVSSGRKKLLQARPALQLQAAVEIYSPESQGAREHRQMMLQDPATAGSR